MTLPELLTTLDQRSIELWFEGNQLRFRAPKGALSEELRAELSQNKDAVLEVLRQKARESEVTHPLSHNQQALWFLKEAYPESPAYNVAFSARFCSEVNLPALRNACQALVDRHPMLRTTYVADQGIPLQRIHGYQDVCFEVIDASSWDDEKLREQVIHSYRMPFDLELGPLFRVSLFTGSSTDHVFLLAAHHIAMDGWSTWLIIDELRTLYSALSKGMTIPLPRPKNHYLDYVNWQAELLNGETGKQLWDFWRQQLDGKLSALDLPSDRPRSSKRIGYGASHTFSLSEDLTQRIKGLAKAEGVTLYMLLLAAYQTLLYRYTGQEYILVGSPMSGRSRPEFAGLVGCFVNTVTLLADFTDHVPFRKLLNRTRQTVLDALNHQDYPMRLLTQQLRSKQGIPGSPIFQVDFALQKPQQFGELSSLFSNPETASARIDFGGIEIKQFYLPQQEGQLDITLEMMEGNDSLFGILKYNTDLFDASAIGRMVNHFQNLLKEIVSDPDQLVTKIPILGERERRQLLSEWNDNSLNDPQLQQCIHQLFEAQALKKPHSIAIVFEEESLTYKELNERANQLAHYLIILGVQPDTLVGVHMERSLDMIVVLLGILKAGGAYVPLDPAFPSDRLEFMLVDSGASILLTQQKLADQIKAGEDLTILCIDSALNLIAAQSSENILPQAHPEDLAYVIYTSGSTGKPKGVQIQHRSVVNFLTSMRQKPGLTAKDRLLSVTTLSFDISVLEVFLPLTTGACVAVVPGEAIYDGAALIQHLSTNDITVMQATPATWQMLIDAGWQGDKNLKVLCGGEAMPKDLAKWLTEHVGSVWNMYGPTETTVWSTLCEITHDTEMITIGRPIANTQIYILDQNLEPTPIGVAGELYIAGDGVARGYLKQPELTAEKFLPDPFRNQSGTYMYKTGDQARYLADGQIDFLGRADFQVKVRGFRIELGEIETTLNSHPDVCQAVVIAREDTPGDKRLVAYLISETDHWPEVGELRQFIRVKLPEYMVPSAFVFLDEFPMSPNRKVNRTALPVPDTTQLKTERNLVLPRTATEEKIANLWASVLGVEKLDIHDNFFDLGGHSLLATRVISFIHEQFHIDLPLRILFMTPTIAEVSEAVDTILWATQQDSTAQNSSTGNKDEMEI